MHLTKKLSTSLLVCLSCLNLTVNAQPQLFDQIERLGFKKLPKDHTAKNYVAVFAKEDKKAADASFLMRVNELDNGQIFFSLYGVTQSDLLFGKGISILEDTFTASDIIAEEYEKVSVLDIFNEDDVDLNTRNFKEVQDLDTSTLDDIYHNLSINNYAGIDQAIGRWTWNPMSEEAHHKIRDYFTDYIPVIYLDSGKQNIDACFQQMPEVIMRSATNHSRKDYYTSHDYIYDCLSMIKRKEMNFTGNMAYMNDFIVNVSEGVNDIKYSAIQHSYDSAYEAIINAASEVFNAWNSKDAKFDFKSLEVRKDLIAKNKSFVRYFDQFTYQAGELFNQYEPDRNENNSYFAALALREKLNDKLFENVVLGVHFARPNTKKDSWSRFYNIVRDDVYIYLVHNYDDNLTIKTLMEHGGKRINALQNQITEDLVNVEVLPILHKENVQWNIKFIFSEVKLFNFQEVKKQPILHISYNYIPESNKSQSSSNKNQSLSNKQEPDKPYLRIPSSYGEESKNTYNAPFNDSMDTANLSGDRMAFGKTP